MKPILKQPGSLAKNNFSHTVCFLNSILLPCSGGSHTFIYRFHQRTVTTLFPTNQVFFITLHYCNVFAMPPSVNMLTTIIWTFKLADLRGWFPHSFSQLLTFISIYKEHFNLFSVDCNLLPQLWLQMGCGNSAVEQMPIAGSRSRAADIVIFKGYRARARDWTQVK